MKPKEAIRDVLRGAAMFGILFVLCVAGCFMNPPKIYGLCGVKLGEKWNGEYRQFLNSSSPVVSTLEDGRVYRIEVKLERANLARILELIQKKYEIEPESHYNWEKARPRQFFPNEKFDNYRDDFSLFKDPHSNRQIKVWRELVDDNAPFANSRLDLIPSLSDFEFERKFGHPRGKMVNVHIEALDVDLLLIASKESDRKQDERDRELIKGL